MPESDFKSNFLPAFAIQELRPSSPPQMLGAARELLLEYGKFLASHGDFAGFCYGALEQEAADLPGSYMSQGGGVLLAGIWCPQGDEVRWAGSIAWRMLPGPGLADAWEIKRLWTRAEARGMGVGRALIEAVIVRARRAGKHQLLLDTIPGVMVAAISLYASMGFLPIPCYSGPCLSGGSKEAIVYMRKLI